MKPSEIDPHLDWFLHMQASTDYLGIEHLQAGMAYAIWARNAYVGIWLPEKQGFLISRYKASEMPYLFVEYHWDTGGPSGTAKPLRPLESCPFPLLPQWACCDTGLDAQLCAWLDALEARHPPLSGWDSVGERRQSAASFVPRRQELWKK